MLLLSVLIYFLIITGIAFAGYSKKVTASDFIIGNRTMNPWTTALAAHASDMSNWLFMAYPGLVFAKGIGACWIAIGLVLCMYLNWKLLAPRIRVLSERSRSLTISSYFESRFNDTSGKLRIYTALVSMFFYAIYISAGLVGMGLLFENIFGISYTSSILLCSLIIISYVLIGGYKTLARIDLFQGLFLLGVIVFVPTYLLVKIGGWNPIITAANAKGVSLRMFPEFSVRSSVNVLLVILSWGLGYFGQPAIVTKFMGIKKVESIRISRWIGMSWLILSLFAASLVGLVGLGFFGDGFINPEMIFVEMVKASFGPFLIGLLLCGVFSTTINVMSAQILVIASNVSEDFYKKIFRREASSRELLLVSRLSIFVCVGCSCIIAFFKLSTIYSIVHYAWSGLGASFGPLLLLSVYSKRITKEGAWAGILSGGGTVVAWTWFNKSLLSLEIDSMLPGFIISIVAILVTSALTEKSPEFFIKREDLG